MNDTRRVGWKSLVALAVLGAAIGYVVAARSKQIYRADALILVVPQRIPEDYVKSVVTTKIEDRLQAIANQILSRTRLERIIQDFNLYVRERRSGETIKDITDRMRDDITVKVERGDAFRVSYVGQDQTTVHKVTDRLSSLFIEEGLRDREVLAEGTTQFFEAQVEDVRRRLFEMEPQLHAAERQGSDDAAVLRLEYETLEEQYKDLSMKKEQSRMSFYLEAREIGEQFKLLDSARRPDRPFSPNRAAHTGYGALAGLGLGLAMFFALPKRSVGQAETLQPQEV